MADQLQTRLGKIAQDLDVGREVEGVTVRELLSWFGAKKRGYWIVQEIREALVGTGLKTVPDFDAVWIDAMVTFLRVKTGQDPDTSLPATYPDISDAESLMTTASEDLVETLEVPAYRVSRLEAANRPPVRVAPQTPLMTAVTIMMAHDFSQLPVMSSDRDVKGIISWRSIAERLAVGRNDGEARSFMNHAIEVEPSTSVFKVMSLLSEHEYVLVRGSDRVITGIVTTSDLTVQYRQWTEPFLLIGEIEQRLRGLVRGKFDKDELRDSRAYDNEHRTIESVHDLTFGELVRLVDKPENWNRLGLPLDRCTIVELLTKVNVTRNDVMHFDPDGIADQDLDRLRSTVELLERISELVPPAGRTEGS
jgi:predicted transcriptional regulator